MQLYMSSYRLGKDISTLEKWKKEHGNDIIVIPNAVDVFPDGDRKISGIDDKCNDLREIGFNTTILDLRNYFGKQKELFKYLIDKNAFYVIGGNVFTLRQAMKLSGFDDYLLSKIDDDNILYSGFSAGICVLANNLKGLDLVDRIDFDPYDYGNIIMEGVGVIDYLPVPHYQSNHPESEAMNEVVKYLETNNLSYKTLRDGEVIIENSSKKQETKKL